jgi:hypothetical protein
VAIYYGIEVPTHGAYRFVTEPGDREVAARHDFAVLSGPQQDADRMNLVELKQGPPDVERGPCGPDCPKVRKDLEKLILERAADGKCMLHICHAADAGTVPSVLEKYNMAMPHAVRRAREAAARNDLPDIASDRSWFSLFVLVIRRRGREGGDRPVLLHQGLGPIGGWLARAEAGAAVFREDLLEPVPLEA